MDILDLAGRNQQKALENNRRHKNHSDLGKCGCQSESRRFFEYRVIDETPDIDFHIYTPQFSLSDSFQAMVKLTENKSFYEDGT